MNCEMCRIRMRLMDTFPGVYGDEPRLCTIHQEMANLKALLAEQTTAMEDYRAEIERLEGELLRMRGV